MHHALRIEEILDIIFNDPILHSQTDEDVWPAERGAHRKYPLLSLALTCRTFHEPATRALWRRIDGIDRLVRTMSRDVVKAIIPRDPWRRGREIFEDGQDEAGRVEGKRVTGRYIVFEKEPTEVDWGTFDRYAAYIHELGNTKLGTDRFKLEDKILQVLRSRFIAYDKSPLPKLRILTCGGCTQLRYANLLLSPQLHTLRIRQSPHECCFSCISAFIIEMKSLPVINLQNIYLSGNMPTDLVSSISELLARCQILRRLDTMGIQFTPDMIKLTLRNNTLEEISAKVTSFNIGYVLDGMGGGRDRRYLKKFEIESRRISDQPKVDGIPEDTFYSELIRRLRAPGLVDFRFRGGPQHPFAQDIGGFLEIISRGGAFCDEGQAWRMPCIRITPIKYWNYVPPPEPLPEAYICTFVNAFHVLCNPLDTAGQSRFSQLRVLDLHDTFVDLTDSELGLVAQSVPHLKSLTFCATRETRREKSRTTLVGLWLLAKHCKELESVSMWIDAVLDWDVFQTLGGFASVPVQEGDTRRVWLIGAKNEQLRLLHVGDSTIRATGVVVDFIKSVFPRIENLHYVSSREPTRDMEMWRAVRHDLD